ncbi:MAG: hypothetical protein WCA22_18710 [Candidatus Binatus sp.]
MKDFFVHRIARGLIIPFVSVICVILAGAGPARAGKNAPVEVGFVGVPPPGFQNVLLNVQAVRINPNASAGPGSGKWATIPVPPGVGGGSGQKAELQIDLNTSQNVPQLFNTANVRADSYQVAEILLDPNNPGTLIPNCPKAPTVGSTADGCINYPIALANGQVISTPISGFSPGKGKLSQLVLQVSMTITQAPTTANGAYTVNIVLSPITSSVLGTITGSVTVKAGSGGSTTGKVRQLAVTAEAIGTNTAIATAQVQSGTFTLALPAGGGPGSPESPLGLGTLYDLAVSGGGDSYAADRLVPLYPGQSLTDDFTVTGNQTLGNITGQITDNCVATKPIVGATLQLLVPPNSNPTANCFDLTTADQCVTVATANTDNAGDFPLPGTITIPPQFQNVPQAPKANPNGAYAMEISAPGYDSLIVQAKPNGGSGKKSGGTCAPVGSTTFGTCDLALNTGYITGSIPITSPNPGQTTLVQVFAEDMGTNTVESALPMPISVTNSNPGSVNFTLNVPTFDQVPAFDLYATTIDLYQGVTDPYQGHTIAVLGDVAAPAVPTGPGMCNTTQNANFSPDETINCIGHGSVTGTVANADLGTSVVLSKQDPLSGNNVQIATSLVQNQSPNSSPSNSYAFCVPADIYQLQTVEMPLPSPSVVPSAAPTPEPTGSPTITVTIPPAPLAGGPVPTPTPAIKCPTTCSNPNGSCPGICNTVIQTLP